MDVVGFGGFARQLAESLGSGFIDMEQRAFPDGEVCPRILGNPRGRVLLAARMSLPIDPNRHLVEMMLASRKLKAMGCDVWMAMPYFIYSRQDKSFREGEPLSAKDILELFNDSGVSRAFVVSSHADRDSAMLSFSPMPAHNIDGYSLLGERIGSLGLEDPMVVGADMAVDFVAKKVAAAMGCDSLSLEKERDLGTGEVRFRGPPAVGGKDVVIVDDIISSGGTMAKAAKMARASGARTISIAAVHLTKQEAIDRLNPLADNFIVTDSIETPVSNVSIVKRMAEEISRA